MSAIDDLVSTGKGMVSNLSALVTAVTNAFPRINGTFTLANATATVVTQSGISASSIVEWSPTNSAASQLLRTRGLFLSGRTVGANFTLSTDNGTAAGTETFSYIVVNPS